MQRGACSESASPPPPATEAESCIKVQGGLEDWSKVKIKIYHSH